MSNQNHDSQQQSTALTKFVGRFEFEGRGLAVITHNSKRWWIARQVGAAMSYGDDGKGLIDLVGREWAEEFDDRDRWIVKGQDLRTIKTVLGEDRSKEVGVYYSPTLLLLSESGIYKAAILSRKPEGRRLRDWLSREVMPELRRSGGYQMQGAPAPRSDRSFQMAEMQQMAEVMAPVLATATAAALAPLLERLLPAAPARAQAEHVDVPELTVRAEIVRLHRSYCIEHGADFQETWRWFYREFRDRYHVDAAARAKNLGKGRSALDVIEGLGKLKEFYALILKLTKQAPPTPAAPVAPPPPEYSAEADRAAREAPSAMNKMLEEQPQVAPRVPRSERNANRRPRSVGPLAASMLQAEREAIIRALHKHKGNNSRTALELRVSRRSLYDKITDHGLRELADELRVKNGVMGPRSTVQKKAA